MNEFTWRTDTKAHKYITDNKLSPNPALARYLVGLQAFRFTVEWIPGLRMIADPFSRMVVINGDEHAFSIREVDVIRRLVFGEDLGRRLLEHSDTSGTATSGMPASVLFTWSMSNFPSEVGSPSRCLTKVLTTLSHPVAEQLTHCPELPFTTFPAVVLSTEFDVPEDTELEDSLPPVEVGNVHTLLDQSYSPKDRAKLRALMHLREFFVSGHVTPSASNPGAVADVKWVRWRAKKLTFDGSAIWKIDKSLKLKVLETPKELLNVLKELHDRFGHRALPAVYHHFKLRYWVPAAAKVIKHYIEGCASCQRLAAPNKFEVPGYQVQLHDVLSHWSVDCVGPFRRRSTRLRMYIYSTLRRYSTCSSLMYIHIYASLFLFFPLFSVLCGYCVMVVNILPSVSVLRGCKLQGNLCWVLCNAAQKCKLSVNLSSNLCNLTLLYLYTLLRLTPRSVHPHFPRRIYLDTDSPHPSIATQPTSSAPGYDDAMGG